MSAFQIATVLLEPTYSYITLDYFEMGGINSVSTADTNKQSTYITPIFHRNQHELDTAIET